MLTQLFEPIFSTTFTPSAYLICMVVSLLMGALLAWCVNFKTKTSKGFLFTLFVLPAIVQTIIMLVNGSIGTGIAVMGAFGLVRFRSAPGSAKEIVSIFMAMAIGLATAIGYVGVAIAFTVIMCVVMLVGGLVLGINQPKTMRLQVTVPENIDYMHAFDQVFETYMKEVNLFSVKTTHMGSLYKLQYDVVLNRKEDTAAMINDLRCCNGNLEVVLGYAMDTKDEL
ncbi:MAG: DUF4956 domain-containing protein [Erysipelotrichaceae bacterium]